MKQFCNRTVLKPGNFYVKVNRRTYEDIYDFLERYRLLGVYEGNSVDECELVVDDIFTDALYFNLSHPTQLYQLVLVL